MTADTDAVMLVATPLTPSPSPQIPPSGEETELTNFQVLGIASAVGAVLSVVIFVVASLLLYRCKKEHHHQRRDYDYVLLATGEDNSAHIPQSLAQPNENSSFYVEDELMNSSSVVPKEGEEGGGRDRSSSLVLLPSVIERHVHHAQENSEKDSESTEVHYKYGNATEDLFWVPASREGELRAQLLDLHVPEVQRGEIEVYEVLGSGQFGMAHRGVWLNSKQDLVMEVALKCLLTCSREEERVKFLQETAIMGQFKHPNVLGIIGMVTTSEPLMILCEIMHRGDLHHYLKSLRTSSSSAPLTKLTALFLSFCQQVASGMAYLAYKLYVHGNLEARNVLVSRDDVCKITNFGISRSFLDEESSDTSKVRIRWMAPEVLTSRKYSTASDVWSYGILLYEIWAMGVKPYHTYTSRETLQKVLSGYRLSPPSGCPQNIYQLMLSCWNHEAESRLAFSEIVLLLQNSDLLDQRL